MKRAILKIDWDTWQTSDGAYLIRRQYKGLLRKIHDGYNVLYRAPDGTYRQTLYGSWFHSLGAAFKHCKVSA